MTVFDIKRYGLLAGGNTEEEPDGTLCDWDEVEPLLAELTRWRAMFSSPDIAQHKLQRILASAEKLEGAIDTVKAELAAANARADEAELEAKVFSCERDEWQSEAAALRAENERLRLYEQRYWAEESYKAKLAAANALLERIGAWADVYGSALVPHGGFADTFGDGVRRCKAQVKALLSSTHLAGQPAAPTRTAAEQRVLDAVDAMPIVERGGELVFNCEHGELGRLLEAQNARREGK